MNQVRNKNKNRFSKIKQNQSYIKHQHIMKRDKEIPQTHQSKLKTKTQEYRDQLNAKQFKK